MKATKLLTVLGVATFAVSVFGTPIAQAVETGKSEGKVQFVEDEDEEIVDPTVPPGTVDPPTKPPINPPVKENGTKIVYYPNLDFGVHRVTAGAANYNAAIQKDEEWTNGEGTKLLFPAFLQVQHDWDVTGWDITATLGDFQQGKTGGILKDAVVEISTVTANNTAGNEITETPATIKLTAGSATGQAIASFANAKPEAADGLSINSVLFGSLSMVENETTGKVTSEPEDGTEASLMKDKEGYVASDKVVYNHGIQLQLPAASGMKAGVAYTADLEWTLSSTLQP